jgi:ribose transport system substrate-binding protein
MMRAFASLALVALAALVLAACGSSDDDDSSTSAGAATSGSATTGGDAAATGDRARKSYKIALVTNEESSFYITLNAGAQAEAERLGVEVDWQAPRTPDLPSQTATLQSVLARRPDGVLMTAVDRTGMVAPIRQLQAQRIPVIMLDSDVADRSVRMAFIGTNNEAAGRMAAETMDRLLGGRGKVAYEGYVPGIESVDQREAGWRAGLAGLPGLESVGQTYDRGDLADVAANVNGLLRRDPDLGGIFASWTNAAIGTAQAVQNAGKTEDVHVVAMDADQQEVTALRTGSIDALVVQQVFTAGELGVRQMVEYLDNGTRPTDTLLDPVIATRDNVDDPEIRELLYRAAE